MNTNHKLKQVQQKSIQTQIHKSDAYSFFNLLTSSKLLSVVDECTPLHRERIYTPTTTLSLFLAQAMNADSSCQNTVDRHAVERIFNGLTSCSTITGGYCKARQRLPIDMVASLVKQTGLLVSKQTPRQWQWQDRPVKLVDGTTVSMPDTRENQNAYPQQNAQKPGLGFPIARIVGVICLSSGVILDAAIGKYKGKGASEHALFRQLLHSFEAGDIVLADRYYSSYFLIAMLQERGVDIVFQQHAMRKTDFRTGEKIGVRDHVASWKKPKAKPDWMSQQQYDHYPDTLRVRELKSGKKTLITTLLSDKEISKKEISNFYKQRWHVELDLRNIKTTLGMEILSCKTPEMNEKEMWVYFLAYNLIRLVMAQAAVYSQIMPRELSFKHTLQIWLSWSITYSQGMKNIQDLLVMIAQIRVGNRAGRIEPRAVKRRSKPYSLLMQPRDEARADILEKGHPKKLK
ncbi:MAG: IS4 family transposase [Thiohalomonadales bacterium]